MLNIEEINKSILELENHDTTYATCEKLAWLYTVKDHIAKAAEPQVTPSTQGSEFLEACSGVDLESLLNILNEHLEVLRVLYPREYTSLINRINAL